MRGDQVPFAERDCAVEKAGVARICSQQEVSCPTNQEMLSTDVNETPAGGKSADPDPHGARAATKLTATLIAVKTISHEPTARCIRSQPLPAAMAGSICPAR